MYRVTLDIQRAKHLAVVKDSPILFLNPRVTGCPF